jgi:hypothetical protein
MYISVNIIHVLQFSSLRKLGYYEKCRKKCVGYTKGNASYLKNLHTGNAVILLLRSDEVSLKLVFHYASEQS